MSNYRQYNVSGRGLCIIFANFVGKRSNTAHLKGYIHDVKALKTFFSEKLHFTVKTEIDGLPLRNLSRQQFEDRLLDLQSFVQKEWKVKGYDRLFVFILSHGGQKGLSMCKEGTRGTKREKNRDGSLVCMPVDAIISYFTHETIPILKDVPKCFFIQACRSNSYVQVASDAPNLGLGIEEGMGQSEESESGTADRCLTITGADIFVTYSTHEYTRCFVDAKGSAFISTTVKNMHKSYQTKDLFEIMTDVINQIAKKEHTRFFPCNSSVYEIRVYHKGAYCPFKICGKLKEDETELPVVVQSTADGSSVYSGFISHETITVDFENHSLSGWVYFRMGKQKVCTLEGLSFDQMIVFHNSDHFLIEGELRNKTSFELLAKGTIIFNDRAFCAEGAVIKLGADERKDLDLSVLIQEDEYSFERRPISFIINQQAKLYIDSHLYGCGVIDWEDGYDENDSTAHVCGIDTDVYQLPLITSTLRKRLFLTEPEKTKVDRQNIAAIMQLTKEYEENLFELMRKGKGHPVPKRSISGPSSRSLDVDIDKPDL